MSSSSSARQLSSQTSRPSMAIKFDQSTSRLKQSLAHPHTNSTDPSTSSSSFSVGDRVKATNQMVGLCRFIGLIDNKPGLWVGIDLGPPLHDPGQPAWAGKGKNSGSVNGISYFECEPACGIFFPISKVAAYPQRSSPLLPPPSTPRHPSSSVVFPRPDSPTKPSFAPSAHTRPSSPVRARGASPVRPRGVSPVRTRQPSRPTLPAPNTLTTPRPRGRPSLHQSSTRKSLGNLSASTRIASNTPLPPTPRRPPETTTPFPSISTASQQLSRSVNPRTATSNHVKRASLSASTHLPSLRNVSRTRSSVPPKPSPAPTPTPDEELERALSRADNSFESPEPTGTDIGRREFAELVRERHQTADRSQPSATEEQLIIARAQAAEEREAHLRRSAQAEAERSAVSEARARAEAERDAALEARGVAEAELNIASEERDEAQRALAQSIQLKDASAIEFQELKSRLTLLEAERVSWADEREELSEQLSALRTAGQSLCGVYEDKMAEVEARRQEAVETCEQLRQELAISSREAHKLDNIPGADDDTARATDSQHERRLGVEHSAEALEIDNERLRADLKYTRERLGEVQDQMYELKQQFDTEVEQRERIERERAEEAAMHKTTLAKVKAEEVTRQAERQALQHKLHQAEMRLKDCVETMEQDRSELEGLRDELMVGRGLAGTKLVPTNTDDEGSHQAQSFAPPELKRELDRTQAELDAARRKLGEFEVGQRLTVPTSAGHGSDEEKLVMMNQYQSLMAKKDEENMKLTAKLEELMRGRPGLMKNWERRKDSNGSASVAGKEIEEILGLKLIVAQSDEDRLKVEGENRRLRVEIAELKATNRMLEEAMAQAQPGLLPAEYDKTKRLQTEIDELERVVEEMRRKHAKEVDALNREVAELESMVEDKVLRDTTVIGGGGGGTGGLGSGCELCGEEAHGTEDCPIFMEQAQDC